MAPNCEMNTVENSPLVDLSSTSCGSIEVSARRWMNFCWFPRRRIASGVAAENSMKRFENSGWRPSTPHCERRRDACSNMARVMGRGQGLLCMRCLGWFAASCCCRTAARCSKPCPAGESHGMLGWPAIRERRQISALLLRKGPATHGNRPNRQSARMALVEFLTA